MNYLTTPFSVGFNPNTLPSYAQQVNGMSTKTNAVRHALDCDVISSVEQLVNLPPDNLLIEPLWFKPHSDAFTDNDTDTFEKRVDALQAYAGNKYLLCSEFTPLRWFGKHAEQIVDTVTAVFASCEFQRQLLKAIDIDVEAVVYEPVNEHLFYPTEKQEWVVAIGSPTHVKNVEAIVDIFKGLQDSGLKRIFIGAPIVWGRVTGMKNETSFNDTMRSYERLKAVCDEFYTASPPIFVAHILSQAAYYLNFAYHETCCRTGMEAMLSGTGILAGKHPLWEEYICIESGLEPFEAVSLLNNEAKPGRDVEEIRDWALKNVSYTAFRKNIEGLLK